MFFFYDQASIQSEVLELFQFEFAAISDPSGGHIVALGVLCVAALTFSKYSLQLLTMPVDRRPSTMQAPLNPMEERSNKKDHILCICVVCKYRHGNIQMLYFLFEQGIR